MSVHPMENKALLGELGEKFVAQRYGWRRSADPFDSTCDMTDEHGRKIEVKTQNRFNGMFTVNAQKATNLKKCLTVDELVFVEYGNDDFIRVWSCSDRFFMNIYTVNSGRIMAGWPINRMVCLIEEHNPTLAARMRELSSSRFIRKD